MIINDLHAIYDAVGIHRGYTASQCAPDGCTLAPVDRQHPPLGPGQRYPDSPTSRVLLDGVSVEVFAPQAIPLAEVVAERLAAAAARRWQAETGGVVVAGTTVRTDRESQALINGACVACQSGILTSVDFKGASGWVAIPAASMLAIAAAVARHVQASFSREWALTEAIGAVADHPDGEAAAVAALMSIDLDEGWPA